MTTVFNNPDGISNNPYAASLLRDIRADVDRFVNPGAGNGGGAGGGMADMMRELSALLRQMLDRMGGQEPIYSVPQPPSFAAPGDDAPMGDPIAGSGRIWGDPHFIGQDGGKYDVQGEAGKSYNLLSDKNFQMNGRFDQYKNTDGLTVVGQVGIAAGTDQIEVNKDGSVTVNGRALQPGQSVTLADGGSVSYDANGGGVSIKSGEWETDIQFRNKGNGPTAHLNIDVRTDNAVADGVRPHGLLGQTFDADDDARNGDKGKGTQGGGAIEDANGSITERGDREAIGLYEVDSVHDRNFTQFNHSAGEPPAAGLPDAEMQQMMQQMFMLLAQMIVGMSMNSAPSGDAWS